MTRRYMYQSTINPKCPRDENVGFQKVVNAVDTWIFMWVKSCKLFNVEVSSEMAWIEHNIVQISLFGSSPVDGNRELQPRATVIVNGKSGSQSHGDYKPNPAGSQCCKLQHAHIHIVPHCLTFSQGHVFLLCVCCQYLCCDSSDREIWITSSKVIYLYDWVWVCRNSEFISKLGVLCTS